MPTRGLIAGAAAVLCALLLISGCGRGSQGGDGGEPRAEGSAGAGGGSVITLASGLSDADRERFYHLAEGSEVIPYAWVRAVRSVATKRPFLEQPERFGLLSDPANRDGLPIGLTAAPTRDTRLFRVRMTGINCAACHVNEIQYQGKRLRIDGAPALFQADSFKNELRASLKALHDHPLAFIGFLWRLRFRYEPGNPHLPAEARGVTARLAGAARDVEALADDAEALAGGDPGTAYLVNLARRALDAERDRPPVDMLRGLQVAPDGEAQAASATLPEPLTYAGAAATAAAIVPDQGVPATGAHMRGAPAGADPVRQAEHFIADVILTFRLLKARIHAFRRVLPTVDEIPGGPGRVDAFGVARNSIYPQYSIPGTAPVSYPWLWGFGKQKWYHYDANTTSVMQRNLGQAIGVGAVYDSVTRISTLDPRAIHWMEEAGRRITPPVWPEEVLGRIDAARARRGEVLFGQHCASCHSDPTTSLLFPPGSMGTDRNRLTNFALPMYPGVVFTDSAGPFLTEIEKQAYRLSRVPADSQKVMSGPDAVWRTTVQWNARPVRAAWATAPYLHNGSVPTLYDLLLPAARRPRTFPVGHREYDPVKLGFTTRVERPVFVFDTSLPGNGNAGHEYGTGLSEDERMALLEYLKRI